MVFNHTFTFRLLFRVIRCVLDARTLMSGARMRWSLAAHDICFTNSLHATFFALGKCVPVVRGAGVYQPAMDFCVERLERGEWVHIFPEGRVNVDKEHIRMKWGVGRLVAESAARGRPPLVLPVWHEGMDRLLPNVEPYRLRTRNRLYLAVGEPLRLHALLDKLKSANASEEETRRAITERIQDELMKLRERAHALIRRACGADCALDRPPAAPAAPAARDGRAERDARDARDARDGRDGRDARDVHENGKEHNHNDTRPGEKDREL
ncbi:unnamed protein product [Euphydryas editha]|uniref:Tafazzin family protein n=1 Tax=Euphydryas editha TaxID=104508 RepID=A0AAU9TPF2_EUPED|nr:unnamed protein product [Euphydryas editha]